MSSDASVPALIPSLCSNPNYEIMYNVGIAIISILSIIALLLIMYIRNPYMYFSGFHPQIRR